jgi:predicted ATPase
MQDLTVGLENFRSFEETPDVNIRPLTFLVGENSAGKTSFLAALNFILRFQESDTPSRLNLEPFDLGSFDQVAFQAKGAYSTSNNFSLSFSRSIDVNNVSGFLAVMMGASRKRTDDASKEARDFRPCSLKVTFGSVFGNAEVIALRFSVSHCRLEIALSPELDINVYLEDGSHIHFEGEQSLPFKDLRTSEVGEIRSLAFVLQAAFSAWRKNDGRPETADEAVEMIFLAFSAMMKTFPSHIYSSAPIRSIPQRVYSASDVKDTPDGRATPYRLRRLKVADRRLWSKLHRSLNEFGQISGLFKSIDIGKLTREAAGPFQVRVNTGIRRDNLADVGYGVSQTLPLIDELLGAPEEACFLFQQPEVHLHPRAQAGLGTFLAKYASAHLRSLVVVETHSDYLIDRVRTEIRNGAIESQAVSILYFEKCQGITNIHEIRLDNFGNILSPPPGYRDFFLREQASILGVT